MRVLQVCLGLMLLPWSALYGAQSVGNSAGALPPNAPAIPTTIRNAPFTADVITQYDRELLNGNHIHRETRAKVFRDKQGRVRTETEFAALTGGAETSQHIAIQDPLLREVIHLDPRARTATIRHLGAAVAATTAAKAGNFVALAPQAGQGNSDKTILLQRPDEVRTVAVRTESLGLKSIEGVAVAGTRTTRTMQSGSGETLVAVSEVWYSQELQMVILSESDDGQSGHSVMKVTNIVRAEPEAQLFQVPPDYTIKDSNSVALSTKH